jgi:hypothetical protein
MQKYRPTLESLELRETPSGGSMMAGPSFTVDGSTLNLMGARNASNFLTITDDGSGGPGNIRMIYNGQDFSSLTAGAAINTINIWGGHRNDYVHFTLTGGATGNMTVNANLGNGNDWFVAELPGGSGAAVFGGGNYAFNAWGGHGHDFLALNAFGGLLNLGAGSTLSANFHGGAGNDLMVLNYDGDNDGTLNFTADGRHGRDQIFANVNYREDFVNIPGTSNISIRGGERAYMSVLVRNFDPATANVVNARVDGSNAPHQQVIVTNNVVVRNLGRKFSLWIVP